VQTEFAWLKLWAMGGSCSSGSVEWCEFLNHFRLCQFLSEGSVHWTSV